MRRENPPGGEEPTHAQAAEPSSNDSGEIVAPDCIGPYLVVEEIGRGGMGVVWKGYDTRLDRPVALKTITGPLADDERWLERFVREAKLLASLSHPHIAVVHDLPQHGKRPVIVMELLDGSSLLDRVREAALSFDETIRIATELTLGLEAAHERGIVHGDLKPANVQVLDSGQVKILDFGLARSFEWTSQPNTRALLAGTPGYMSPEQVRREFVDARSDLFNLGVLMFEGLTGQRIFPASDGKREMSVVITQEPRWELLPKDTPEGLRRLIEACLQRDANKRPGSAREVRMRLEKLREDLDEVSLPKVVTQPPALPAERDAFVGRHDELAQLTAALTGGGRFVTVLGPVGVGKTRLVTRLLNRPESEWSSVAWFCDLSEARSVDGLVHVVAAALGVTVHATDGVEAIGRILAGRGRSLLVLDNFEQLVDHADDTLGRWLTQSPDTSFLVTSREKLHLSGEDVLLLEPLPVAGAGVELFVERGRAHRPGFALTDENREAVLELVRLLEGLPLAIELAAARLRVLSPAQQLDRMKNRFQLLSGTRPSNERQATLRNALEWSWDLLEPWEQAALAQASVFAGGFTMEAAEAVLDLSQWFDAPWTMDAIQSLVDKSLLRTWIPGGLGNAATGEPYFGMYTSIQEHAREKLCTEGAIPDGASGPTAEEAARVRHGKYHANLVEGSDDPANQRRLELALDNLVIACRRARERGDGETARACLAGSWRVLKARGPIATGLELGLEVAELDELEDGERAKMLLVAAEAAQGLGDLEAARGHYEGALVACRAAGDRPLEGVLLSNLGNLCLRQHRLDEAAQDYADGLAIHREVGNRRAERTALNNLGALHEREGRLDEARELVEVALLLAREDDDHAQHQLCVDNLVSLSLNAGKASEARALLDEALEHHRSKGARAEECRALLGLGMLLEEDDELTEARARLDEALAAARELDDPHLLGDALGALGGVLAALGEEEEAEAAFAEGERHLRRVGHVERLTRFLVRRGQGELRIGHDATARSCLLEAETLAARLAVAPGSRLARQLEALREGVDAEGGEPSGSGG
ncbi:MAG: protein kinase [Acidobacteriota bacterium]